MSAREALEAALGHRFARPEQLAVALTHRSFGEGENNEKLEFARTTRSSSSWATPCSRSPWRIS